MSKREINDEVVAIHPRALKTLGLEISITMLGVARDLKEGKIENFYMGLYYLPNSAQDYLCSTPCCIWGHTMHRLGEHPGHSYAHRTRKKLYEKGGNDDGFWWLCHSHNPSDPKLAARAIERYVLEGSEDPWGL